MAEGKKLTKREKKAASFRQKQKKSNAEDAIVAIPESDILADDDQPVKEQQQVNSNEGKNDKKRKADQQQGQEKGEDKQDGEEPKKKKTRRGKKKTDQDKRFIIFVGNLPYATTKEGLEKHFESVGGIVSTRLLTDKVTKKPKGFAFMEFESSKYLSKALAFHHTLFMKRQINVELTAGGGGKNENRAEKLKTKNERLQEERQKAHQDKVHGKIPVVRSSSSSSYGVASSTADEF